MLLDYIIEAAVGIIVIVLFGVFVVIYNTLIMLKNNVTKAWSNIDVLLEKRHDLIGKLVDTVKGYMKYERSVLTQLTAMRTSWTDVQNDNNVQNKIDTSNQITGTLKTLFADIENYPDLKADTTVLELQKALEQIENEIADRREFYNDTVNEYNIKIKVIPFNFFSGMLHYTAQPFFQAPNEAKQVVNADLS